MKIPTDITSISLKPQSTILHDKIQTLNRLISRAITKDTALFVFVQYQNFLDVQNIIDALRQRVDTGIKLVSVNCQEQNIQFLSPYLLQKQDTKLIFCIFNLPRRQDSPETGEIDPGFLENLNFTRDPLQEHRIKAVFFLTPHELSAVVGKADDFWAFRHRLLELPAEIGRFIGLWSQPEVSYRGADMEEIQRQIGYRKSLLDTVSSPEKKVSLINEIAERYIALSEYQKALSLLEQGLKIAAEIGDKAGEGTTLNNISLIYHARGDYETALEYLKQSLDIRQQIGDKAGEGTTLNNIAALYHARGDYETALEYLKQSLDIRQQIGDKAGEGTTLNNIAALYHARGDYETALEYLKQSLDICRQIGDKAGEGATLNNISQIYHKRGDYETALEYLKQSLDIRQQIGDIAGEAVTSYNIARIYEDLGKIGTAIPLMKRVVEIDRQTGRPDYEDDLAYLNRLVGRSSP